MEVAETAKKKLGSRTTVRLPENVHKRAKVASAQMGIKIQEFVAQAIEEKLKVVDGSRFLLKGKRA